MKPLSPATLGFLLHCYTQPDNLDYDLNPWRDEIQAWVLAGILRRDDAFGAGIGSGYIYRTTPLGDAWVKSILKTPVPTAAFVDGAGNIIT